MLYNIVEESERLLIQRSPGVTIRLPLSINFSVTLLRYIKLNALFSHVFKKKTRSVLS